MLHQAALTLQFNVHMRRVKHCCNSRLLFRRGGVRYEAFKVRYCFLARREAELDDAWSSYEIAQAILIVIGNNESFRPVLFAGCLYNRVAHTCVLGKQSELDQMPRTKKDLITCSIRSQLHQRHWEQASERHLS